MSAGCSNQRETTQRVLKIELPNKSGGKKTTQMIRGQSGGGHKYGAQNFTYIYFTETRKAPQ